MQFSKIEVIKMTTLRKNVIELLEKVPEEKLYFVIQILQGIDGLYGNSEQEIREQAYEKLESLRRKNLTLEYDKELENYRKEKYGTENID